MTLVNFTNETNDLLHFCSQNQYFINETNPKLEISDETDTFREPEFIPTL